MQLTWFAPRQIPYEGIKGVSITLNYATTAEAQKVFNALADAGQVAMATQPSSGAKHWGMLVVDKSGARGLSTAILPM